jgi:uncharacterized protein
VHEKRYNEVADPQSGTKVMLIQLTIRNFLSFRNEVTFSMLAVNSDQQHLDHLTKGIGEEGASILPLAAIYGANAAGKSNLIEALIFAKKLIIQGTRSRSNITVSPFRLGGSSQHSSQFEFIFTYQSNQYSYGFELNKEQIIQEWLYGIPAGRKQEKSYFERITSEKKETSIEFGTLLKSKSKKRQTILEFIAEGTRPNQLFLTEAVDRNVQELIPVFDWFRKSLTIIPAESAYNNLELGILSDTSFTEFLSSFLKSSGTGIDSIVTETIEFDPEQHLKEMPKKIRENLVQEFSEVDKESIAMIENPQGGRSLLYKDDTDQISLIRLKTRHLDSTGQLVDFLIEEESDGTQRLINLIPALFALNTESEKVIFVDELDRRLHTLLSRFFLQEALRCKHSGNQLIFTTHDTHLLDLDLLRRDEIWFVEKDISGSSNLYSLSEFKVRPDLKLDKGYLSGRFGAIPFFGNPQTLGWNEYQDNSSI